MTTLILRCIRGDFVITGPDIEPVKFKTRREAKDWCRWHHASLPVVEVGRDASKRVVLGSMGRPKKRSASDR
jgi:hypothetical protein